MSRAAQPKSKTVAEMLASRARQVFAGVWSPPFFDPSGPGLREPMESMPPELRAGVRPESVRRTRCVLVFYDEGLPNFFCRGRKIRKSAPDGGFVVVLSRVCYQLRC